MDDGSFAAPLTAITRDVVLTTLADAAAAGRFDVVAQLARELEARLKPPETRRRTRTLGPEPEPCARQHAGEGAEHEANVGVGDRSALAHAKDRAPIVPRPVVSG